MPTVAHIAPLTLQWNSRWSRLCTSINSGHMSRGMCGTIKPRPAFATQRVFMLTGGSVCLEVWLIGKTQHVLIRSAVMKAAWYPGQMCKVSVRISGPQTKKISWLNVHHPVNHMTPIPFHCSFKLQGHGRNVITFNIVVATQQVCVEAWKQARNTLQSPPSQLKPSPTG